MGMTFKLANEPGRESPGRKESHGLLQGNRAGEHPRDVGGALKDAMGIPEEQLRRTAASAVCKINIDSDGRLAMTAMIRKVFAETPAEFDPRKYLGQARGELKKMIVYKNTKVVGSAGRA